MWHRVEGVRRRCSAFRLWEVGETHPTRHHLLVFEIAPRLQRGQDRAHRLAHVLGGGVDVHLGVEGCLVGITYAGEIRDLAAQGSGIEALHVSLQQLFQGTVDEDLDEIANSRAHLVTHRAIWRDGGGDDKHSVAGQELGHKTDAPDVDVAIFLGEAKAPGKVLPDDVTVEDLDPLGAQSQLGCQRGGDGRLARSGQAGEPDGHAARRLPAVADHFSRRSAVVRVSVHGSSRTFLPISARPFSDEPASTSAPGGMASRAKAWRAPSSSELR